SPEKELRHVSFVLARAAQTSEEAARLVLVRPGEMEMDVISGRLSDALRIPPLNSNVGLTLGCFQGSFSPAAVSAEPQLMADVMVLGQQDSESASSPDDLEVALVLAVLEDHATGSRTDEYEKARAEIARPARKSSNSQPGENTDEAKADARQ
ncbi:unnamed protein product, partial [Symbiodinium sp. KB8]